jgi:hypothetical protein
MASESTDSGHLAPTIYIHTLIPIVLGMRECTGKNPSHTQDEDTARNGLIKSGISHLAGRLYKDELGLM